VLAGGQAWCYVRSDDEDFERIAVDLSRPVAAGYFETEGFEAGQAVVVAGAGLMLAYETGGVGEED